MKNVFFESAKKSLLKAERILSNSENEDLHYAALELRLCIESIVYSRLQKLASDKVIDTSAYMSWQPNKILDYFLSLDPYSLTETTLSIAKGNGSSIPSKWIELGKEYKIDKKFIRNNYHKLGAYLHQKMVNVGHIETDYLKIRESLTTVLKNTKKIMSSDLHNINHSRAAEFKCIECNKIIKLLVPTFKPEKVVTHIIECPHSRLDNTKCIASYNIFTNLQGQTNFSPKKQTFECLNNECNGVIEFWEKEILPNTKKSCMICNQTHSLAVVMIKH